MPHSNQMIRHLTGGLQAHPRRLLIVAACFHLAVTTMVFSVGRMSLMPSQFDREGIGQFAADGYKHLGDAIRLTNTLEDKGVWAWLTATAPLHVRAYSVSLVILHRLAGNNILTVWPVNLLFYLAILVMVFQLARKIFDQTAALLATVIVAVWPTFLIHTTQPLRDQLLIVVLLALFLIIEHWLKTTFSWRQAAVMAGAGVLVLLLIWLVRLAMWDITRVAVALGFLIVIGQQVARRKIVIPNLICGVLMLAALFVIPRFNNQLRFLEMREVDYDHSLIGEEAARLPLWERIFARRDGFIDRLSEADYRAGSDLDTEVRFRSRGDVIRYLPRAAEIGLFAPFPNSWFAGGLLVGRTGRLISGFEMMLTYVLELLAVFGAWRARRNPFVWLVAVTAFLGATALGLIVINIGSLYRLRYSYFILLVILAAGGIGYLASWFADRKSGARTGTATNAKPLAV